jgi:hypothetical protein
MRPSEKFEAKAAGQKCSPDVVFSTLRTFFHRQRRHQALQPAAIERVIWIGSKLNLAHYSPYPHTQSGFFRAFNISGRLSADK